MSSDQSITVAAALSKLRADVTDMSLLPDQRDELLQRIRAQFQTGKGAEAAYTEDGIDTLCKHGFNSPSKKTAHLALRCLANCMLLQPATRQIFVDLGYSATAANRLKTDEDTETEFIITRILFYTTYDTNVDFTALVNDNGLAETMNQSIARHAKRYPKAGRQPSQVAPHDMSALTDTAKLLYNILHYYPSLTERFTSSIAHLFKILYRCPLPSAPLDNPTGPLINALAVLDLDSAGAQSSSRNPIFPKVDTKCNAEHLIKVLDKAVLAYSGKDLDVMATPVLALIRKIYELAPDGVKAIMRQLLLPKNDERNKPLGKSETLSSRLLRLSTNAMTPNLRKNIPEMYFEISGKDASTFVQNIGYGFAAGFLMSNNIDIPASAKDAWSSAGDTTLINPITGQRLDAEALDTGPEMTEEEKEREAERLFVLFERLKQTGIIDVQNPVEQAINEGRFEELD